MRSAAFHACFESGQKRLKGRRQVGDRFAENREQEPAKDLADGDLYLANRLLGQGKGALALEQPQGHAAGPGHALAGSNVRHRDLEGLVRSQIGVNGELVASFDVTVFDALMPSDKSLSFGVRGDTKDVHWMMGTLDEAAIFDEALSEEEIQNIMDSGLQAAVLAVSSSGRLATTWGSMKNGR